MINSAKCSIRNTQVSEVEKTKGRERYHFRWHDEVFLGIKLKLRPRVKRKRGVGGPVLQAEQLVCARTPRQQKLGLPGEKGDNSSQGSREQRKERAQQRTKANRDTETLMRSLELFFSEYNVRAEVL